MLACGAGGPPDPLFSSSTSRVYFRVYYMYIL